MPARADILWQRSYLRPSSNPTFDDVLRARPVEERIERREGKQAMYARAAERMDALFRGQGMELGIDPAFIIGTDVDHPYECFKGLQLRRIKRPDTWRQEFHLYGRDEKFEIFVGGNGEILYITPSIFLIRAGSVPHGERYISVEMKKIGLPGWITYHSIVDKNRREVTLDSAYPALCTSQPLLSGGEIIGILAEMVWMRREIIEYPIFDHLWIYFRWGAGDSYVYSCDALNPLGKLYLVSRAKEGTQLADSYVTDKKGQLVAICEFGYHDGKTLGRKLANTYYLLRNPEGIGTGDVGLRAGDELVLDVAIYKGDEGDAFVDASEILVCTFLSRLAKKKGPVSIPKLIIVRDLRGGYRRSFDISGSKAALIGPVEDMPERNTLSDLEALIFASETILTGRRTYAAQEAIDDPERLARPVYQDSGFGKPRLGIRKTGEGSLREKTIRGYAGTYDSRRGKVKARKKEKRREKDEKCRLKKLHKALEQI